MPEPRRLRTPSDDELAPLARAKSEARDRLLAIPGVHMVGIGYKRRGGAITDELALVVFVDRKLPPGEVKAGWMVPAEVAVTGPGGERMTVITDVVERARPVEYPHLADGSLAGRVRPVPGGRSIQGGLGGGTLGGWVWDDRNDAPVLLSNRHVLGTTAGGDVFQPWGSSVAADRIADNVRTGTLDATIAAPSSSAHVLYEIEGVGPGVYETTTAVLGMAVEKSGATTEHTTGQVVVVNLSTGHAGSTNDFEVHPDPGQPRFAYFGDSGSLIVERTHPTGATWKRVVGLLWGGDPPEGNAYGHQIEDVFADLGLTTVCAGALADIVDSLFARTFAELPPARIGRPGADAIGLTVARQRGLARDLEREIGQTRRGARLVKLVHKHRVALVAAAVSRESRRSIQMALGPFVEGRWSAREVLDRPVTDEDVARFRRALDALSAKDLKEARDAAGDLLDQAKGRTFGQALARR
ncbi:MAG: S1 family peptidase [Candidatus Nanopelagicales bacterium]|jgi:hypothetical protein|nr:S1 family peptidase [Candidatus Nanopelagicales bacterium]